MTFTYYYKDGDEELKGPFEEDEILDKYYKLEFTSDVEFQIRSSEADDTTPFITLMNLIAKNGHRNPFRKNDELERIEQRMKEIDELSVILSKKPMLEKRLAELEKKLEERKTHIQKKKEETENQKRTNTVQKSKDNDGGMTLRRQKHIMADALKAFPTCDDCSLVLSSHKQLMLHISRSSCKSKDSADFLPDFERWKKEDAQRLAVGQRIFKKMSSNEVGSARPQIDFVEELHSRIGKKMSFEYDGEGKDIARTWIKSEEAKKVSDRFIKHLKEAPGNLVCTRCQVACRSYDHYIIHLITYDHRLKVKGSPMESLSLLVGSFHKEKYLDVPHPSELDEDLDLDACTTVPVHVAPIQKSSNSSTAVESEEYTEEKNAALKQQCLMEWAQEKIMSCKFCNLICSSYKQWVIHSTTEEHEEKSGTIGKENSATMEKLFSVELQKWRWEDRVKLSTGKRLFESMSEAERKDARPTQQFTDELTKKLEAKREEIAWAVRAQGKTFDTNEMQCLVASFMETDEAAQALIKSLEAHLNKSITKKFICRPCKVVFDDTEKYFAHCQMSKHLLTTNSTPETLMTTLICMQKSDLYLK